MVAKAEGDGRRLHRHRRRHIEHLPGLLEQCENIPVFVYLDPCGLVIPLDEVASIFDRPSGYGTPATEVLINLTAHIYGVSPVML